MSNNGDLILNVTEYHLKTVCDVEYTVTGKLFSSTDREKEERERERDRKDNRHV